MPELPEVETTRRGLASRIVGSCVENTIVRTPKLRWPIPKRALQTLHGQIIRDIERRGKYLLFRFDTGTLIIHLGMSGCLSLHPIGQRLEKHDHVDFILNSALILRYNDPRRFGAILWCEDIPSAQHPLLKDLGPEPLSSAFQGKHLYAEARRRKVAVKPFIMDHHVVVGVGNIYATEALFQTGIDPRRPANQIDAKQYDALAKAIKATLKKAIRAGGTTLKDYMNSASKPGYFQQQLLVYGKAGKPCPECGTRLEDVRLGQRSSVFCPACQQ